MGGVTLSTDRLLLLAVLAVLVALLASTLGLALGCTVGQQHIGLMFSLVLAPMIFRSSTPAKASATRSVPAFPHLPLAGILVCLVLFNLAFLTFGPAAVQEEGRHVARLA